MKKAILLWLFLALLVASALTAQGQTQHSSETSQEYRERQQESPPAGAILGDLVILRPFGIIFTGLGVVGTVAALPFSIPTGSVGTVAQKLIADPFSFTFNRPLGVFSPEVQVPWN